MLYICTFFLLIHSDLESHTKITILFPLCGIIIIVCSFGYLILAIKESRQNKIVKQQQKKQITEQASEENTKDNIYTIHHWILFGLFAFFYFFYVGAEVSYGSYITTFAVRSKLSLSKQVGAEITAIFWGSFAAMRFASIFAAIYLRPIYVMVLSCFMSGIGKKNSLRKIEVMLSLKILTTYNRSSDSLIIKS